MKLLSLSVLSLLLVSCSWVSFPRFFNEGEHSGAGDKDESGNAVGVWTIYEDVNDSIFAKGAFVDGKPDGVWEVWDDAGTKNAELNFANGTYQNQYLLFYTSYTPLAEGRLKTIGATRDGRFEGGFSRYYPSGEVFVKYNAVDDKVVSVQQGEWQDAQYQLEADQHLLNVYREAIIKAPESDTP